MKVGIKSMQKEKTLEGRTLYIPQMNYAGPRALAAVLRSVGIDADVLPSSDKKTDILANKYLSGDECYPSIVTLGDTLKLAEEGLPPEKIAIFMPTAGGPCRFGQYAGFIERSLVKSGYGDVLIVSPTSENSYQGFGNLANSSLLTLIKAGWIVIVSSDILEKLRLKTRPYEVNKGETDTVFKECVEDLCQALEKGDYKKNAIGALKRARERFRNIPVKDEDRPLIGIVGEIFTRMNSYSNAETIRKVEEYGGEAWMSDVTEWIWYTLSEQKFWQRVRSENSVLAKLKVKIREISQHYYENSLVNIFKEDFKKREEPDVEEVLSYAKPYLPQYGAHGEMVLNIGKAVSLYHKGADGVIDISPFTCMNGIATEAIYPRVSSEHDDIPIKVFYFDGTQTDLDRDIGIFMELARNYQRRKKEAA